MAAHCKLQLALNPSQSMGGPESIGGAAAQQGKLGAGASQHAEDEGGADEDEDCGRQVHGGGSVDNYRHGDNEDDCHDDAHTEHDASVGLMACGRPHNEHHRDRDGKEQTHEKHEVQGQEVHQHIEGECGVYMHPTLQH